MKRIFEQLRYELQGPVARITLNRPKKLNAITQLLYRELRLACIDADHDQQVEIVLMTGEGRAFCAGGDLAEVNAMHDDPAAAVAFAEAADNSTALFKQMETMEKPIICMVNGLAHAAGMVLAMQSDIAIASDRASFRLPEALAGMSDVYAAAHLASYIGVARTKLLLFTCKEISAADAERWGLIASVAPHEELEKRTFEVIDSILNTGTQARVWNKLLINRSLPPFDNRGLKATIKSADTQSGTQAFGATKPAS